MVSNAHGAATPPVAGVLRSAAPPVSRARIGDGTEQSVLVDTTGDGRPDTIVRNAAAKSNGHLMRAVDTNGDGKVDSILLDTTGDGKHDTIGRATPGASLVDTTGDGQADSVLLDTNGDGLPDTIATQRPSVLTRTKTTNFDSRTALRSGKMTPKEINQRIEREFHTGTPSTGKELINECLQVFLPSLRLALGRVLANLASQREDFGDFVLEVKPVNPRDEIDERFPERLIEALSVKLGRVKVRRTKLRETGFFDQPQQDGDAPDTQTAASVAEHTSPNSHSPAYSSNYDPAAPDGGTSRSGQAPPEVPRLPNLDSLRALPDLDSVRQSVGGFIEGLAETISPRGASGPPPPVLAATAQCLNRMAEAVTPRVEVPDAGAPRDSGPSHVVAVLPSSELSEMQAALRLQAAMRGRSARKAVDAMGWKPVSTLRPAKKSLFSGVGRLTSKKLRRSKSLEPSKKADDGMALDQVLATVVATPKQKRKSMFGRVAQGMKRRMSRPSEAPTLSSAGGFGSLANAVEQGRDGFRKGLQALGLGDADSDDEGEQSFVQTEGGAKNLQALGFDLELEINLKLPKPQRARRHDELRPEERKWVPIKFGLSLPNMKAIPKIKLQIIELHLKACARVTHDMRDNELTIGFIKDKRGNGPNIGWDVEARMGKLELPDFIEDKLPAMLVNHLLANFTPASPLKIPLDIEHTIQSSIVKNDVEELDVEIAEMEGALKQLKERRKTLTRRAAT